MSGLKEIQNSVKQSPNWERFKDATGFIEEGFPFDEGIPTANRGKQFEIIRRDGGRVIAKVDDSRQYRAEGCSWVTDKGESVYTHVVVAWQEKI